MRFGLLARILTLIWLFYPGSAFAFKCDIIATPLNFGSYNIFVDFPTDSTATLEITCNVPPKNPASPLAVTISASPGNSGNFAERQMQPLAGGSDRLSYNLYTTPSFSTVLGDGSGGSQTLTSFVTRDTPWTATVYGRIPPRQNVSAGPYNDVIVVTILW